MFVTLNSKSLSHATANDLLASCNEIMNTIDSGNKIIQILMDWKLFELIQKDWEENEQKSF